MKQGDTDEYPFTGLAALVRISGNADAVELRRKQGWKAGFEMGSRTTVSVI